MARLGEMIRRRRDELGLTLDDLQARTKIRGKYLEAIEAGEYQVIPGEVYLRGFIRSISSELDLDPDLALQAYRQDTGKAQEAAAQAVQAEAGKPRAFQQAEPEPTAPTKPEQVIAKPAEVAPVLPDRSARIEPRRVAQPRRVPWVAIGLALLLIAAGYWYWTSTQEQLPAEPPITQDPGEGTGTPGPGEEPGPEPGPLVVLQDPSAKDPVYLVKSDRINVNVTAVTGQCWLRAEWGNQVVEKTLKAGSDTDASVGFQSDQQVRIKLGKAPAVKLTINGEEQPQLTGEQVRTVTIKTNP